MIVGAVQDAPVFGKLMAWEWFDHAKLHGIGMSVLTRDSFTCQGCGFRSRRSRQVPHGWMLPICTKHPGLLPVSVENSKTYCPFCASSMGLNWSVVSYMLGDAALPAPGMLIAMKEMSQIELNRLALYVVSRLASRRISELDREDVVASDINNAMRSRQNELPSSIPMYRVGKDSYFAKSLALMPVDLYQRREEVIGSLRWWPNFEYWQEQGIYWRKASY